MMEASRFWPPGYYPADELEIAISDEEGYMDEVDYGRPRTPEPARSPRDIITKGAFHPAPPGRGPVDDRATVYGPWGPSHGPLAHKNGQALLRNTDMGAMRVSPPNKLDPRGGLSSLPRSPRGPGAQSGFGLPQSPVPHPPPK
ncbi:predicted protein [Nematostella vectensis]|uniref:Uncharacterized protein n=2 Tax=Nematostella vectensis TaxID=45351 RepID=A7RVI9_NEMVE|nr:predicted protein [Nematostella vectensis]|eukprot:XP_001636647.1 predicted protein [Nematostella vectensis]